MSAMTIHSRYPGILAQVAAAAGDEAALALMRARGGMRCYIPARARAGHWMTELLGEQAAAAICKEIGGGEVEIPVGSSMSAADKRRRIASLLERGWPVDRVAHAVGVDRSTVKRHKRRLREARRGPDLFSWRDRA
jgi:DNA-binding NarL/FixJ family response regulator